MDWGDVPTWVASITTSATLIATLYIVRKDRRERQMAQARRIQASLIEPYFDLNGLSKIRGLMQNNSDAVIDQVTFKFGCPDKTGTLRIMSAVLEGSGKH